MNKEGASSQAPKFENIEQKIEIESEPPRPTKLPYDQNVRILVLSPNSKYAATISSVTTFKDHKICGWQLDLDQPVKQKENESYQPISFKLDCLINTQEFNEKGYPFLLAVSNNKLVAIK
ncbi:9351_t:CDS:1 [Racocetra fulgida]|uniref:9351_t:CDS:1 n=1 Tax=Racocetra fulgida TaxID=60492 RepID=A0A9N9A9F0_9GLOM|nr:9351_t:CDS:1 [Racocetra fulgida]